jgi:hypothetical protein
MGLAIKSDDQAMTIAAAQDASKVPALPDHHVGLAICSEGRSCRIHRREVELSVTEQG